VQMLDSHKGLISMDLDSYNTSDYYKGLEVLRALILTELNKQTLVSVGPIF
jgi:hypothetical protein